jgi:hypothetical protein
MINALFRYLSSLLPNLPFARYILDKAHDTTKRYYSITGCEKLMVVLAYVKTTPIDSIVLLCHNDTYCRLRDLSTITWMKEGDTNVIRISSSEHDGFMTIDCRAVKGVIY